MLSLTSYQHARAVRLFGVDAALALAVLWKLPQLKNIKDKHCLVLGFCQKHYTTLQAEQAHGIILSAMAESRQRLERHAALHKQQFLSIARQFTNRTLNVEPYLSAELARQQLWHLQALERFSDTIDQYVQKARFDPSTLLATQVQNRVALESERAVMRLDRALDKQRQQAVGVQNYIWRTSGDEKVRGNHQVLNNRIFSWNTPPGGFHPGKDFGCRCYAEPVFEDLGEPYFEPVDEVQVAGRLKAIKEIIKRVRTRAGLSTTLIKRTSKKIANGHAFTKHVVNKKEFSNIKTIEQFEKHIANVMENPTKVKRLTRGRIAFWHEKSGTVVIRDPSRADLGTAFKAANGIKSFNVIE